MAKGKEARVHAHTHTHICIYMEQWQHQRHLDCYTFPVFHQVSLSDVKAPENMGRFSGTVWCNKSWRNPAFISPCSCCFYRIFRLNFPQATLPAGCYLKLSGLTHYPKHQFSSSSSYLSLDLKCSYQFAQQITKTINSTWGETAEWTEANTPPPPP